MTRTPPAPGFLSRLMSSLGLDPIGVETAKPHLFRDMQRKCVACESQERCMADLDRNVGAAPVIDYCPNADVLVSLQLVAAIGASGRYWS